MLEERKRPEAPDPPDGFEWVNAWAAQAAQRTAVPAADGPAPSASSHAGSRPGLALVAGTDVDVPTAAGTSADFHREVLLAGDIIEIAEARDALLTPARLAVPGTPAPRLVWLPAGLGRTADSVPIILGSVLGFLMVLVFVTAAMFVRLAR